MLEAYKRIKSAIDEISTESLEAPIRKPIIAENVAKRAKVSRATLYRYLHSNPELRETYDAINRPPSKSIRTPPQRAQNFDEALATTNELMSQLTAARAECESIAKSKNAQIMLLWNECARLRELINDLKSNGDGNIFPFS